MAFTLTEAQVAQYHKDGFLLVRAAEHRLVSATDLQTWAKQVQTWPRVKGKWMPYDEINVNGERQLMRTEKFVDYHAEFDNFLRGEGLTGVLAQLSGAVSILSFICIAACALAVVAWRQPSNVTSSLCYYSKIKSTTRLPGEFESISQAQPYWAR